MERSGDSDLKGMYSSREREAVVTHWHVTQVFGTQAVATTPVAPHRGVVSQRRRAEKRLSPFDVRPFLIMTCDDIFGTAAAFCREHVSQANFRSVRRKSFAYMAFGVSDFSL